MRAAKVQASLRIRAVSPEPSLLAHISSESRGTFRQKARSLAPLNGWACAVKVCHDGMLEDTNLLGGAHIINLPLVLVNLKLQHLWVVCVFEPEPACVSMEDKKYVARANMQETHILHSLNKVPQILKWWIRFSYKTRFRVPLVNRCVALYPDNVIAQRDNVDSGTWNFEFYDR